MCAKAHVLRHIGLDYRPSKTKFSQDGSRLLIASEREILSCSVINPSDEVRFKSSFVSDVAFLSNEHVIAVIQSPETSIRSQKKLAIYDIKSAQMMSSTIAGNVFSMSAGPHKQRIFVGREVEGETGGYLDVYDFALKQQYTFKTSIPVLQMAISHSGDKLAVFCSYFELWNVSTGLERIIKEYPPEEEFSGYPFGEVCAVDITPDGRWIVVGVYGGKADCFVVNGETGNIVGWYSPTRNDHRQDIHQVRVAISPNGKFVAITRIESPIVYVYQVSDGALTHKYQVGDSDALTFSPHGDILAMSDKKSVTLWTFEG